jgi:hypothetical protein
LLSDATFRGFRQALADVTSGEADVFQFSIAKLTEECNIRRAYPARDFGSNPAVYEVTQAGHNEPKRFPDCRSGRFGVWGNIEYCHRNFLKGWQSGRWARKKFTRAERSVAAPFQTLRTAADRKLVLLRSNVAHSTTKAGTRATGRDML